MKLKTIILAASVMTVLPLSSQETYQMANIETQDLNGTARFVSMGGAMNALGADISTISYNPAGIGIFRKSQVTGTLGIFSRLGASDFDKANKTHASFDQLGFVYSFKTTSPNRVNIAVNYHKSHDFNQILMASGILGGDASQNKLTATKFNTGIINYNPSSSTQFDPNQSTCSALDALYAYNLLTSDNGVNWYNAKSYQFGRNNKGYISDYDFNMSGCINNRIFLGMTFGIQDVHYRNYTEYYENGLTEGSLGTTTSATPTALDLQNEEKITGSGVDLSFGGIFLPFENSPFRIGAWIKTPTFYDLTATENVSLNLDNTTSTYPHNGKSSVNYDFKFNTPWKFGIALGNTFGKKFALDIEYEFADYGSTDARIDNGGYYDYYGDWNSSTSSDDAMNANVKECLKGVSTVRFGFEYKPITKLAFRLGYNYISPMYDKKGYRDPSVQANGNWYSTTTDYTIWRSTNSISLGIGYIYNKFNFDLAYQYTTTSGEFFPFTSSNINGMESNLCQTDNVKYMRNHFMFTVGYNF